MRIHPLKIIVICTLALSVIARGESWDVTAQFSATNNPTGAWTYGSYDAAGLFVSGTSNGNATTPGWVGAGGSTVWKNLGAPQFGVQTGQVALHPGSAQERAAVRWTAGRGGRAEIAGTFFAGDSAVLDYAVWHNAVEQFHVRSGGNEAFDLARVVTAGDDLEFLVYGGYLFGNTPLAAMITLFISGDANRDGVVNLNDFNALAANFGQSERDWFTGDFSGDGVVNLTDFNLLAGNFGQSASPGGPTSQDWSTLGAAAAAVPEPSAAFGVLGAAAVMSLRRRRARRPPLMQRS